MEYKTLPPFEDLEFEFQYDLEHIETPIRFRKIGEAKAWVKNEQDFWSFLRTSSHANLHTGVKNDIFFRFVDGLASNLSNAAHSWAQNQSQRKQVHEELSKHPSDERLLRNFENLDEEASNIIEKLKINFENQFKAHLVDQKKFFLSFEPEAIYAQELSKSDPKAANYAVHQMLSFDEREQTSVSSQFKGRILGLLFEKNIHRKVRHEKSAFSRAIKMWSEELSSYKSDFEDLKSEFYNLSEENRDTSASWLKKTKSMESDFSSQLEKNDEELAELKETYETYMKLEAPRQYWAGKSSFHERQKKKLKNQLILSAILGLIVIGAGTFILPEFHPMNEIPWRNLGIFALLSTFALWFVRIQLKLFLSHTHLHADAEERVVMIQTFLSLINEEKSRESLKDIDISLVLAPIFKPSTTGVIKDDGGPTSLADFISRLGSNQN